MAKVFAIEQVDGDLVVRSWPSKAAYEREDISWLDPRWLAITVTTADDVDAYSHIEITNAEYEALPKHPLHMRFRVVKSDIEVAAHNLMHDALLTHIKKSPSLRKSVDLGLWDSFTEEER